MSSLHNIINNITKQINNNVGNVNYNTTFSIPGYGSNIPVMIYIIAVYNSIETIKTQNKIKSLISFEEFIYGITNSNTKCTGQIEISNTPMGDYITNGQSNFWVYSDGLPTSEFTLFVNEFINRVVNSECPFTSLGYSLGFHMNILLAYYDKNKGKIYLSVYEPHGSEVEKSISDLSDKLPMYMKKASPDIFIITERSSLSCPIGTQAHAKDQYGYCVMFSYFWLYCLLIITNNKGTELTMNDINTIEPAIIDYFDKAEDMMEMIVKFSIYIIDKYIEYITTHLTPDERYEFHKILATSVGNLSYVITHGGILAVLNQGINKVTNPIKSLAKDWFPSKKDKKMKRHLKNVQEKAEEISTRKLDNEDCKEDSECLSDICHENKCSSFKTDRKRRKNESNL